MLKDGRFSLFILAAVCFIFLAVGCTKDDNHDNATVSDQQAISELTPDSSDFGGADELNGFMDDDDQYVNGSGGGLDEPIQPLRWGRIARRTTHDTQVEIQGDTLATITYTRTLNGTFRIIAQNPDTAGPRLVYNKPMFNTIIRKAHARRIANTPFPRQNWRIFEITPEVLSSAAPNPHTVWPNRVDIYRASGDSSALVTSITDPLNTYFTRETIPTVAPETELSFFVSSNDTLRKVGVLHPRVFREGANPRLRLMDNGEAPDAIAHDGIYSGSYTVGTIHGVFLAGLDLIAYPSIFDSEAPYNAGAWSVPYRVRAAQ
jgi:hypothetical protein